MLRIQGEVLYFRYNNLLIQQPIDLNYVDFDHSVQDEGYHQIKSNLNLLIKFTHHCPNRPDPRHYTPHHPH